MKSVDALGRRPERRSAFGRELLAETQDAELQAIVEEAAKSLSTPISLVTLVLDQVQFFKAHYGLPPDLSAARGTSRDVSFCQFVVRDERMFEVNDAAADGRVPKHLVDSYGIQAYLGVPIHANEVVAGSLCVIDTKPREFSERERRELTKLAERVDARLAKLTESRRQARLALSQLSSSPVLSELSEALPPARAATEAGLVATAAIGSFQRLARFVLAGGASPPDAVERTMKAAEEALEECENALYDIDASLGDVEDCVSAMRHATEPASSTHLSEVLVAGQELARNALRPVGGASLPDLSFDPEIYTPRALAVSLVAASLASLAAELEGRDGSGVRIVVEDRGSTVEVALRAKSLSKPELDGVASRVRGHLGEEVTVALEGSDDALKLTFEVVPTAPRGD